MPQRFIQVLVNEMKVLVLYHSQQHGNTEKMAKAVADGIGKEAELWNVDKARFDVSKLPEYDAYAVGTPDYFSYMAGTLKTFMDDVYLAERAGAKGISGKPIALFLSHGGGGRAKGPFETLFNRLGEPVGETVESSGAPSADVISKCKALGEALVSELK
jgi:flavorubredoxin